MWFCDEVCVAEGTRIKSERASAVTEGAAATAPTAPHATPASTPHHARADEQTGPARFWGRRVVQQGLAIGFVVSAAFHYVISPFSIMPSGPPLDFHEQAGELSIPVDLISEGEGDKPGSKSSGQQGGVTGATAGVTDGGVSEGGLGDASTEGLDGAADAAEDDSGGMIAVVDGGLGRDPQSLLGVAGSVAAGPNNVTIMVNFAELRKHPDSARLGLVLGGIPQWRAFMSDSQGTAMLDPMRDADWMIITGPHLVDTQNDAVFVHYATPDAQVDKLIDTVSRNTKGGPVDLGVRGVKAWKAFADNGWRAFIRPRPHIAVIVPLSHAPQFARVLAANPIMLHAQPGESMSMEAVRPGGSIGAIPADISKIHMRIIGRPSDGGGDLYMEGDCPTDAAAQVDAETLRDLIKQKNSFGVRLLTAGFFNKVDVTTAGSQIHVHINGTQEQIEALLALAAGVVHVTLPPPSHTPIAPPTTTAAP